ncbi:MAG: aminopeptidase [Desulfarculaceae bacterium]|nr:aminopeptidase [Desulfarculaceae bacterium]MCF8071768.1 aminopeptidase [Desulfarculaceae bacterium]MCF8101318.1 aminopeptidase [Desulfarculaceae bacterium]MCF8117277.1 aminopeptidase [Desulfarculaceae bacterium]
MAKLTKKQYKKLSEQLMPEKKSVWDQADPAQRKEIMKLGERYKDFLDAAKTERMAVKTILARARGKGFKMYKPGLKAKRLAFNYKGKVVALAVLGRRSPVQGMRLLGSHIDAPRLDLKMNPLYEDQEMVFLKTHYYGGIKKYQWLARPLAIHGVVCTSDGKSVEVHIGDADDDPVFTVLDLLPHLSRKVQESKKLADAVEAERMNLLIGTLPLDMDGGKERVKLAVLKLLNDKYGFNQADLVSAELELVPAGRARDVGLDRSLVGGYGQDDRASAFAALEAVLAVNDPAMTCVAVFVDKEEVGSDGATGAQSRFLEHLTASLLEAAGDTASYRQVFRGLAASQMLSADVNAAFDPDYPEVHDRRNAAYLGYGVCLTKYTGHGGKYGASDADAEYVAWLRKVWDDAKVTWQAAGMGRVDQGGGGTIAKHMAVYGMDIIDVGPSMLAMHSPFEVSAKADMLSAVMAYQAFYQAAPVKANTGRTL